MRVSLGRAMRTLREKRGMSVRAVELAGGPARAALARYEDGTRSPDQAMMGRFLAAVGEPETSSVAKDLLRAAQVAHTTEGVLTEPQQTQLIDSVVRLVLAHEPRANSPAVQLDIKLDVERELLRLGVITKWK